MTTISQKDYALHRSVAPKTVNVWRRKGRIAVNAAGQIIKERSDAMLDARPKVYRGGVVGGTPRKGGGGGSDTDKRRAEAMRVKEHAMCRLDEVEGVIEASYALVGARCMTIGGAVAAKFAACPVWPTGEEAKNIIHAEVIRVLGSLATPEAFNELQAALAAGKVR